MIHPKVLVVTFSDSVGSVGMQADINAISNFGCHPITTITAINVQDVNSLVNVYYIPANIVQQQMDVALCNIVTSVKIGMLGNLESAEAIYQSLIKYPDLKIVLDPVLIFNFGSEFFIDILKFKFIPISYLVTPNVFEAEILLDTKIKSFDDVISAAVDISKLGSCSVFMKCGNFFVDDEIKVDDICKTYYTDHTIDVLVTAEGEVHFFKNVGKVSDSGCAISSSIAALIATGLSIKDSIFAVKEYVYMKTFC